jgi:hypothetical protein
VPKIEKIFLRLYAVNLVKSYLTGRSQCVFANGALSTFFPVTQGVPQCSILGSLLFSLYINDLQLAKVLTIPNLDILQNFCCMPLFDNYQKTSCIRTLAKTYD